MMIEFDKEEFFNRLDSRIPYAWTQKINNTVEELTYRIENIEKILTERLGKSSAR